MDVVVVIFVLAGIGVAWILGVAVADIVRSRRQRHRSTRKRAS